VRLPVSCSEAAAEVVGTMGVAEVEAVAKKEVEAEATAAEDRRLAHR
jgi:hypothetical protein